MRVIAAVGMLNWVRVPVFRLLTVWCAVRAQFIVCCEDCASLRYVFKALQHNKHGTAALLGVVPECLHRVAWIAAHSVLNRALRRTGMQSPSLNLIPRFFLACIVPVVEFLPLMKQRFDRVSLV